MILNRYLALEVMFSFTKLVQITSWSSFLLDYTYQSSSRFSCRLCHTPQLGVWNWYCSGISSFSNCTFARLSHLDCGQIRHSIPAVMNSPNEHWENIHSKTHSWQPQGVQGKIMPSQTFLHRAETSWGEISHLCSERGRVQTDFLKPVWSMLLIFFELCQVIHWRSNTSDKCRLFVSGMHSAPLWSTTYKLFLC